MKSKFINMLVFAVGAAVGSAVTWKVVKDRYERIVQEEIESVKQVFSEALADIHTQEEVVEEDEERPETPSSRVSVDDLEYEEDEEFDEGDIDEYERLVKYYNREKGGPENMASDVKKPYVISPYEFDELDGYRTFELTYYADGILEDEDYTIVPDPDDLLGPEALTTFGEYEDDAVFVRNEQLQADFQILKDYRTYAEARSIGPNQVDD